MRQLGSELDNLAHLALRRGEYRQAAELFKESLVAFHEMEFRLSTADTLAGLAGVAAALGRPEQAARLFGAADATYEYEWMPNLHYANWKEWDRNIALARAQLDDTAFATAWAEGRTMSRERAVGEANRVAQSLE